MPRAAAAHHGSMPFVPVHPFAHPGPPPRRRRPLSGALVAVAARMPTPAPWLTRPGGLGLADLVDAWLGAGPEPPERRAAADGWRAADPGDWCRRCGRLLAADDPPGRCGSGRAGAPESGCDALADEVVVLGADVDPLGAWVRQAKGRGADPALAWWLGRRLGEQILRATAPGPGRPVVVPVPTAGPRAAARGLDHAAVLAAAVAGAVGGVTVRRVLRHAGGARQAGRSRPARLDAAGRTIRPTGRRLPSGVTAIVVDDVRTTGATVRVAASRLRDAGAGRVVAAIVATRDRTSDGLASPPGPLGPPRAGEGEGRRAGTIG